MLPGKLISSVIFLSAAMHLEAGISYSVRYLGLDDKAVISSLSSSTQLSTLQKRPPDSFNAIRYRADADIPKIISVMRSYGYLEATVDITVEENYEDALVFVNINPGPLYTLESFSFFLYETDPSHPISCPALTLSKMGITLNKVMTAREEIEAENALLTLLSECGYPLASIEHREIVADGETKKLRVRLDVNTGPPCLFGPIEVIGSQGVKEKFFLDKLQWKQGQSYQSTLVEQTQSSLIDSGLFSSVIITHGPEIDPHKQIPIFIEVAESKHRSVNAGISYQTYYGPGVTFGWEARNIAGMGRKLSLEGDLTQRSHTGLAIYQHPNFLKKNQDYVWQAQAMHENIIPYTEVTYNLINRLERRIGKKVRMSFGGKLERLLVNASAQNGTYWLVEAPIYFAWNGSNRLLNPTQGLFFEYTGNPSLSMQGEKQIYFTNLFAVSYYLPVTENHAFSIAQKFTIGSILSKNERIIPLSKRFFGGSEEDLRGYAYQSVSPMTAHHKPIGGRSEIFYTIETRFRVSKSIGLVPFLDMGNVYKNILPSFSGKWLKSVGLGFRYFSFMGPFRLDVGFPLNKREYHDNTYRVLVSIGQSF